MPLRASRVLGYFSLALPFQVVSAGTASLGFSLVAFGAPLIPALTLTFFMALSTAAFNSLNAWSDVEADSVSRRERPLAKGILERGRVMLLSVVLYILSIFLIMVLAQTRANPWLVAILLLDLFLTVAYSLEPLRLKRLPVVPNIIASLHFVAVPYLSSWIVSESFSPIPIHPLAILLPLALATMIVEDMVDIEGDRLAGISSTPMVMGISRSMKLVTSLYGASFASTLALWNRQGVVSLFVILTLQAFLLVSSTLFQYAGVRRLYSVSASLSFATGIILVVGMRFPWL